MRSISTVQRPTPRTRVRRSTMSSSCMRRNSRSGGAGAALLFSGRFLKGPALGPRHPAPPRASAPLPPPAHPEAMEGVMRSLILATMLALTTGPILAHTGAVPATATPPQEKKGPEFKLEKLSDRAYCLYGRGGNVGFLVTDAGVVVVDDQYEEVAQGVVDQIRGVTERAIRYLVNTHYHGDHTGGNPVFVKFAEIIAHETVRPRLLDYPETIRRSFPDRRKQIEAEIAGLKDPADPYRLALENDLGLLDFFLKTAEAFKVKPAAPPELTYEGQVRLWLGGEGGDIFHVAPRHTDGDPIDYFPQGKDLHLGDLF